MSSGEKTSVFQTTKNLIEGVEQVIFTNPPPHDVINPDLAVQASQQLGHHTLEVGRRVQSTLGHTRGVKRSSTVAMMITSWASAASGIYQYLCSMSSSPKHVAPRKSTISSFCYCCCRILHIMFILTDRASTIPSNIGGCQSGTWSQRGTKVNGSHHGDNPLLRPTGIQIAKKCYATLHAMASTNNKTVHQTSFTPYREQRRSTRIIVA